SPWRTWCSTRWTTTRRADYVSPPHEPPPLQHADAAGGAVRAAGAAAGYDVHLRPDGVELRAHRKFPDVPVRGSAAPAPRMVWVRRLPHHEPQDRKSTRLNSSHVS